MSKLIPKCQKGNKLLDEYSKYAVLNTYYPFVSKYPLTGHSSLIVTDTKEGGYKPYYIDKKEENKGYNLVTNNCSDATRCALEKAFNKKINPFLFTTPGDVQDFALEELNGIPEIKGDSIYDAVNHKYKLDTRPEHIKKLHKGVNTVYIPLNAVQRGILKQYIEQGNKNKEFKKGGTLIPKKQEAWGKLERIDQQKLTPKQKMLLQRSKKARRNIEQAKQSKPQDTDKAEKIRKEVQLVQNALNSMARQDQNLGKKYKQVSDNQVQETIDKFYPYKNMINATLTAAELASAGYF